MSPAVWLDDGFPDNTKVIGLTDRSFRFYVTGLCHCNQNLTDGHVNDRAVKIIAVKVGTTPKRCSAELVDAQLWRPDESGDGFWINDYLDYNLSASQVKRLKEQKREAGKRGADARWNSSRYGTSDNGSHDTSDGTSGMPPSLSLPYPVVQDSLPSHYVGAETLSETPVFARLHFTVGPTDENLTKLKRAAKGVPEAGIVAALEACSGPNVRDPLAVALAELKKRKTPTQTDA